MDSFGPLVQQVGLPMALLIVAVLALSTGRVYSRDAMERQRVETERERVAKEREREETDRWIATSFRLVEDGRQLKEGAFDALTEAKARSIASGERSERHERARHDEPWRAP